ncbi:MAG: Rieske 2Fe-2S domain-containing protein [Magnetococcales bacterium]|nr:Rieske 2Fe-2S domain-containing protein [Magnetococcales bacterium]
MGQQKHHTPEFFWNDNMTLLPWNEHKNSPAIGTVICAESEIPKIGGKAFSFGDAKEVFRMFIIRDENELRAYINGCTHFSGTPLNPNEVGNFLDSNDPTLIYCGVHGSRFLLSTGACVSGDCDGEGLQPVPINVSNGQVIIG